MRVGDGRRLRMGSTSLQRLIDPKWTASALLVHLGSLWALIQESQGGDFGVCRKPWENRSLGD
jgi:hypothetical protein